MPSKTLNEKNPMKKKSTLKVEEKKTAVETTKKNSTDRADGLFTVTSVKQRTPKQTSENRLVADTG